MYFSVNGPLGQSPEEQREFEELKRQFEMRKAEHEKRLAPLPLGILPLEVFKREGVKTTTRVSNKTASLIQTVLDRSRVLRPYIEKKLGRIMIPKGFVHHKSDAEFESAFTKLHNIKPGSAEWEGMKVTQGFYHPRTDTIHLKPYANVGHALHEAIHKYASKGFRAVFGSFLDEGVTQYFTNSVLGEQGLAEGKVPDLKDKLRCAKELVRLFGHNRVARAYFRDEYQELTKEVARNLNISLAQLTKLRKGDTICKKLRLQPKLIGPLRTEFRGSSR